MQPEPGKIDLAGLRMVPGDGQTVEIAVAARQFRLGGVEYRAQPDPIATAISISRTVGDGWAFKLSFESVIRGECARCLEPAQLPVSVVAREVHRVGGGEDLESPYLKDDLLDVESWANDALLLALPASIICTKDCRGLCDVCGERLADLPDDHAHERPPDPRWEALRRLDT